MSNTCFNCNAKIEDDSYGLTECPSCQTPIFIDFEGHVQKPSEDEPVVTDENQNAEGQEKSSDVLGASFDQSPSADVPLEDQNKAINQSEVSKDSLRENALPQETVDMFSDEQKSQSDFDMPQDDFFTDMASQETTDTSETDIFETDTTETEDHQKVDLNNEPLQEVIDYANSSDISGLEDFYYDVAISGIDSKNLRESVLDALDDSRFGWKKEEINDQIKDGCLTLEKVNAAKAYMLISYLKFLPIKVKWDQVSLTKS